MEGTTKLQPVAIKPMRHACGVETVHYCKTCQCFNVCLRKEILQRADELLLQRPRQELGHELAFTPVLCGYATLHEICMKACSAP